MKEKFGSFILIYYLCTQIRNKPRAALLDRGWTDQTGILWIRISSHPYGQVKPAAPQRQAAQNKNNYGRNEFRWRNGNCCHQS